jgi:hypothetical protein
MERNMPEDSRTASDMRRPRTRGRMDTGYMESNKEERCFPRTDHSTVEGNIRESRRLRKRLMFRHSLRRQEEERLPRGPTHRSSCLYRIVAVTQVSSGRVTCAEGWLTLLVYTPTSGFKCEGRHNLKV